MAYLRAIRLKSTAIVFRRYAAEETRVSFRSIPLRVQGLLRAYPTGYIFHA